MQKTYLVLQNGSDYVIEQGKKYTIGQNHLRSIKLVKSRTHIWETYKGVYAYESDGYPTSIMELAYPFTGPELLLPSNKYTRIILTQKEVSMLLGGSVPETLTGRLEELTWARRQFGKDS